MAWPPTEETLSTLRYADRARKIANKPVQNIEAPPMDVSALRKNSSRP